MKLNGFIGTKSIRTLMTMTFFLVVGIFAVSSSATFATEMVDNDGNYYSDFASQEETLDVSLEVNAKIGEEGFILMKNDGTLPFTEVQRISVLGRNSTDLAYGGGGSGGGNTDSAKTLFDSLEAAGYTINPTLVDFYEASSLSRSVPGLRGGDARVAEVPLDEYTDLVYESFGMYNDAALIVITRSGSEGGDSDMLTLSDDNADPDSHYLELTTDEEDLFAMAKEYFDTIVVIINNSAPVELGVFEDDDAVNGIVWVGHPGENAIMALGGILNGTINPSGRTADIYAADYTLDPTWQNFSWMYQHGTVDVCQVAGVDDPAQTEAECVDTDEEWVTHYVAEGSFRDFEGDLFNNTNDVNLWSRYDTHGGNVVMYEEGIYIGYRYYETRGYEMDANVADGWYDQNVVYPFGYGLSYTDFNWTGETMTRLPGADLTPDTKDDVLQFQVTVTNTGDMAGKDVVQIYANAPYTSGGIEKSYVELAGFAKTGLLQPGQAQVVTIEVYLQDLASYDHEDLNLNGHAGYELEEGSYNFFVAKNSHDTSISLPLTVPAGGYIYTTDRFTGNTVENRWTDTMFESRPYGAMLPVETEAQAQWTEFTRADFGDANPASFPTFFEYDTRLSQDSPWIETMTHVFRLSDYDQVGFPNAKTALDVPVGVDQEDEATLDADRTITLTIDDMSGVAKNDPQWDTFLNQLKYSELLDTIRNGGYSTAEVPIVEKDRARDADGPASLGGIYWASEVTIAATWNLDIAYQMGRMIGNEALWAGIQGWYGPAMNTHRSVFGGRNFEYYSEDGFLAGKMAAAVIRGAQDKGIYVYAKHFALNEQETERQALMTFATEQAIREIYLVPFQMAVQEGGAKGIMSSFNRIGLTDSAQSYALLTEVLRDEWGFDGAIVTDYYYGASAANYYMNLQGMWAAGNNIPLNSGNMALVEGYWDDAQGTVVYYEDWWVESGLVILQSATELATDDSTYSTGDVYVNTTTGVYYRYSQSRFGGWIPAAWTAFNMPNVQPTTPTIGSEYVDESTYTHYTYFTADNDPNVDYTGKAQFTSYSMWLNVREMAKDVFYVNANSSSVTNGLTLSGFGNTVDFRGNESLVLDFDRNADIEYDILDGATIDANKFEITVSGGSLPAGLSLNDGVLEGSIAEAGDYEFDLLFAAEGWIQNELAVEITINLLETDATTCDAGYHVEDYECVVDDAPVLTCADIPGYLYDVATQACTIDPDHEWTTAEVQALIDAAIAAQTLPEDWTEAEIQALIDTAIAAIPDPDLWTEAEIEALIATAIAAQDLPEDWTEAEIQALIDASVGEIATGCGSSINLGTSIVLIVSALGGAVLFFIRKHH